MTNTDYKLENAVDTPQGGDRSTAIRARRNAYQEYMTEGAQTILTSDLDLARLNLEYEQSRRAKRKGVITGAGTFVPDETEDLLDDSFKSDEQTNMELAKDGVNSFLIDMNSTQLSAARGKLIRTVLPELYKLEDQKSIFDEYQKVNSQLAQYENSDNPNAVSLSKLFPEKYAELKQKNIELATKLKDLGVLQDGSNFQEMYDANAKAITALKDSEQKLRASIFEDEADLQGYSVSSKYQEQKDSKEGFQFSDPSKWIYKLPGVLGSSSSSFAWQVAPYATTILKSQLKKGAIKIAAGAAAGSAIPGIGNIAGAAAGLIGAAVDLANYGFMLYSNFKQSENEADAEVYDNYKQRVRGTLEESGISQDKIAEFVKNSGQFSSEYSKYNNEQIFDKVLDGEIRINSPELNKLLNVARSGTDQVYKQNLAITFGTNLISDVMFLPYFGDTMAKGVGKGVRTATQIAADPVGALGSMAAEKAQKALYKHILKRNVIAGATGTAKQKAADMARLYGVVAAKKAVESGLEAVEEGSQYTTGMKYASGEYDNVHEDNLMGEIQSWGDAIGGSFLERATTTANILGRLVGYKNPLLEDDTEYWDNVKLGAAASLFSPMTVAQSSMALYSETQKVSAYNALAELATKEAVAKDNIIKAVTFTNAKFKGKEQHILDGFEQIKNDKELMAATGLTEKDFEKYTEFANQVYSYAGSKAAKTLSSMLGIEPGTEEYGKFVGLAMQAKDDYDTSSKELSKAMSESEVAANKVRNSIVTDDLIKDSIKNAVKKHNDAQTDPNNLITEEEFTSLMFSNNEIETLEGILNSVNTLLTSAQNPHDRFGLNGKEYFESELRDLQLRTQDRLDNLKKSLPKWYTDAAASGVFADMNTDAKTILGANVFEDVLKKKESAYLLAMINERNREILRSFYDMDSNSATATEKILLKAIKANKSYSKSAKRRTSVIQDRYVNEGDELVKHLYDRFVNSAEASKANLISLSGAGTVTTTPVTPSSPIITPNTSATNASAAPATQQTQNQNQQQNQQPTQQQNQQQTQQPTQQPTQGTQPTQQSQQTQQPNPPTRLSNRTAPAIPELSEAEKALQAAEEALAAGNQPSATQENEPAESEEDPFAGMTPDDSFNPELDRSEDQPQSGTEPEVGDTLPEASESDTIPETVVGSASDASAASDEDALRAEVSAKASKLAELLARRYGNKLGVIDDPENNAGLDVEIMSTGVEMLNALFKLGIYKFKGFVKSFYQAVGEDAKIVGTYFDSLKGIYFYKLATSTAAEKAEMDSLSTVDSATAESVMTELLTEDTGSTIAEPTIVETTEPTISQEELRNFEESSTLGILNTFHYNPNGTTAGSMNIDGKVVEISAPSELAPLLVSSPNEFTYELKVTSSKSKPITWGDPNIMPPETYDNAMIGVLATHSSGKKFWLSMKNPSGIESLIRDQSTGTVDQQELYTKKELLRKTRHDIVKLFVKDGKVRTDIKVVPSHVLLHNGLSTTYKQTSINDPQYADIFKFDSDLNNEADNFAFSGGVRSNAGSSWRTLSGNALPYALSSSGGIYYVISGNKRLSGYELPLHIRTIGYSDNESVARLLVDLLFNHGLVDRITKVNGTDLTVSDVFALLWHTGASTTVNSNDDRLSQGLNDALSQKAIYIKEGLLYIGKNPPLPLNETSKKIAVEHVRRYVAMPFQTGENSPANVNIPLDKIFDGRLADSVKKAGGKLVLAQGIEFTTEDLNGTLLAWMIKSGKLTTDLNAVKYNRPFVIVDEFVTEVVDKPKVVVEAAPSPAPEPATPKPKGTGPSLLSRGAMFGIGAEDISIVEMTPSKKMKDRVPAKLDRAHALSFLKDVMGMSDEEITIIDLANSSEKPLQAVSYMSSDSITLMTSDPFGTEYHEAWHRVSLLLMPTAQKQRIYAEFRRTNKEYANASDKVVEEALAEEFRYFATVRMPSKSYVITKWFDKLKGIFLKLMNREDINKIRRDILNGKYRNIPVNQESKARFVKAYGDRANFTQHGLEFKSLNLDSYFSAVRYLSAVAIMNATNGGASAVVDITKYEISIDDLKAELEFVINANDATAKQVEVATELLNNFEAIKLDIVEELRGNAFNAELEEALEEEIEERAIGESDPNDLNSHTKLSFQSSKLDHIRPAVKMFLTSIIDTYGKDLPVMNQETGLFEMVPLNEAWNKIIRKIGEAKNYRQLVESIKLAAAHDNFFNILYFKLSKVTDTTLQTQIFLEISSYVHNFLTIGFAEESNESGTWQYLTLAGSYNKNKLKKEIAKWNNAFVDSGLTHVVNGAIEVDPEKTKPLLERFDNLTKAIDRLDDYTFNKDEYNNLIIELNSIFKAMGIGTDIATTNQVIINMLFGLQTKIEATRSTLKPTLAMALKLFVTNRNTGISSAIKGILNGMSDKGKYKKSGNAVFNNEAKLTPLVEAVHAANNKDVEEKVVGPKNTSLYPVSKHNFLTLEIAKLNADRNYVDSLLSVPINKSSVILKALKAKLNLKLRAGTVINLVEFSSGANGKDFQSANLIETFLIKLVLSEENYLLLPTMSDKGTYMPIEGIEIFKDKLALDVSINNGGIIQEIPKKILDQFREYYESEYQAILQYRRIKEAQAKGIEIPGANNIVRYFGEKGEDGNGGKFRVARGYYRENKDGSVKYHSFDSMTDIELAEYFQNETQVNADIQTMLTKKLNEQFKYLEKLKLVKMTDGQVKWFNNMGYIIDRVTELKKTNGGRSVISEETYTTAAVKDMIAKFTIGHYISMFEAEKIFFKDIAYYKNFPDVTKRLAGALSTGTIPRTDFPSNHWFHTTPGLERYTTGKYNVGGIADIFGRANQPVLMYNAIYNAYVAEGLYNYRDVNNEPVYSPEQIEEILDSSDDIFGSDRIPEEVHKAAKENTEHDIQLYGEITRDDSGKFLYGDAAPINQADATAYCTPTMYKAILDTRGMLTPEISDAIDYLEEHADNIGDPSVYAKTLAAVMHPLKMVYYGNDVVEVIPGSKEYLNVPIFNKMAIYPLFKVLAKSDLKPLYDRMHGKMPNGTVGSPIDMITTYQVVKVGNTYEPSYYTDPTQTEINYEALNEIIIRKQNFMNLLDQMPIEAHAAERRMAVSQAVKTVYSNIRPDSYYTLPHVDGHGVTVTGSELAEYAMTAIKEISTRGTASIKKTLGIVDTENGFTFKDLTGLSKELIRACKASGFSSDMLAQMMLDGKGRFMVPLSASISEKRLFSKLMSQINKKVIDLMLPGGTYVQEASLVLNSTRKLKMADAQAELSESQETADYVINDGNRLKLMRTDGSMEAVISLNAFMHILPDDIKNDFIKSREWLRKNNIIGQFASPAAMGYRVPTQGMSSIAALTITDVLPPQIGDVIILPDEFTARTGADFDIDKLFLTRYNYENGVKVQYDFEKPMSENSTKAVENLLIDTFIATLTNPKNAHDTLRPIDAPIAELKQIQKDYHPDTKVSTPLYEYSPEYQDTIKQEYADSKTGIGPYALNLPNHVLTQLTGLKMIMPDIYKDLGDFSKITGIDGIHILDWLSALVSAHVDVAKDSYIIKLNVNKYTYNMSNFLLRSGIGKNTFFFLSQEILKRTADAYIMSRSVYGPDSDIPAYRRFKEELVAIDAEFEAKAIKAAEQERDAEIKADIKKTESAMKLFNERMELIESAVNDQASADILTDSSLLEAQLAKKVAGKLDFTYYLTQLQVSKLYKDLSQYADALGELVHASQIDTKKFGKTPIELRSFNDRYDDMRYSAYFDTEDIERYFNSTFLETMRSNSIDLVLGAFSSQFVVAKPAYYDAYKSILRLIGVTEIKDERTRSAITNALDAVWRSNALYDQDNRLTSTEGLHDMFFGTNTIARRLNTLKNNILEASKNGDNTYGITVTNGRIDNRFLNSLTGMTDPSGRNAEFITTDYSDIGASNLGRQMREYWESMLNSQNDEVRTFAEDLITYAIFNGHGAKHMSSLFDFIPQSKLEELGYYSRVRELEGMSDADLYAMFASNMEDLFRNNWHNDKLVPKIWNPKKKPLYVHRVKIRTTNDAGKVISKQAIIAIKGSSINPIGRNENNQPIYHPFVKRRNSASSGGFDLYKYIGNFSKITEDGVVYEPLYVLTNKKGVKGMVDASINSRKAFNGTRSLVTEYTAVNHHGDKISEKTSVVSENNNAPRTPFIGKLEPLKDSKGNVMLDKNKNPIMVRKLYYSTHASDFERVLNRAIDQVNYIEDSEQSIMDTFVELIKNESSYIGANTKNGKGWVFNSMDSIGSVTNMEDQFKTADEFTVDEDGELHESTTETKRQQPTEVATETVAERKTYTGRITKLDENGIFVFGSNTQGRHGKGAALTAKNMFKAVYGRAKGLQGQSYAIVTKDLTKPTHPSVTRQSIEEQIAELYKYANENPGKEMYVAYAGSGANLNGYSNEEMAQMFASSPIPNNIVFEAGFNELVKKYETTSEQSDNIESSTDFNNNEEYPNDAMNNCKGK